MKKLIIFLATIAACSASGANKPYSKRKPIEVLESIERLLLKQEGDKQTDRSQISMRNGCFATCNDLQDKVETNCHTDLECEKPYNDPVVKSCRKKCGTMPVPPEWDI